MRHRAIGSRRQIDEQPLQRWIAGGGRYRDEHLQIELLRARIADERCNETWVGRRHLLGWPAGDRIDHRNLHAREVGATCERLRLPATESHRQGGARIAPWHDIDARLVPVDEHRVRLEEAEPQRAFEVLIW